MNQGKMNGYICQGFNPLAAAPNKAKMNAALAKLKFLVIMDPLATETSEFWRNFGEHNDVDPSKIQTEVFRLPTPCFAEEDGALVNSSRWLQWHWKGAEPPGEARTRSARSWASIFTRMRALYASRRRRISRSDREPDLAVRAIRTARVRRSSPGSTRGKALKDLADPKDPTKITRKAGEQLAGFAELRDDGSTLVRLLDLLRRLGPDRQPHGAARQLGSDRDRPDAQLGLVLAGQPARHVQPRLLRSERQALQSRAQADRLERHAPGAARTSRTSRSTRIRPHGMGPFIMNPEGVARFFARGNMAEGPFPEHYEPFETPLG